jgi:peroxiredoxin
MTLGIGRRIAMAAALTAAALAAGCAGAGGGQARTRSVFDLTWGWGWDLTGSATGPYSEWTPVEREKRMDYYRAHVRTEDAAGNPLPPAQQVEFVRDAKANAPTGQTAAPAAFVDIEGRPVRIEDWRGRKSLVLVFTRGYPGYICPLCTSYTAQIAYRYPEIAAAGAEVLLVFPGSPDKVEDFVRAAKEIAEQEGPGSLPFPVLLDTELKGVDAFGIRGDLARPSTYVIDRKGTVRYAFVGSEPHERPDVDTILAEIRRAGAGE